MAWGALAQLSSPLTPTPASFLFCPLPTHAHGHWAERRWTVCAPLHVRLGSTALEVRSLQDLQEVAPGWVILGVGEALMNGVSRCAHLCGAGREAGAPAGVSGAT